MTYIEVTEKFIFGSPVDYHGRQGQVTAMDDRKHTVTVEVDGKPYTDVYYKELKDYKN